jgi:hypothetical protein
MKGSWKMKLEMEAATHMGTRVGNNAVMTGLPKRIYHFK